MKECTMPQSKNDYCSSCYVSATGNVCTKPDKPCYWHTKSEKEKKILKDKFEQRLICNWCNTDKMYVIDVDWDTYIICTKCGAFVSVRGE